MKQIRKQTITKKSKQTIKKKKGNREESKKKVTIMKLKK